MSDEWTWRYDGASGAQAPVFPTQSDAEAWLGESWQQLADEGVTAVTLVHGDEVVYGPMPLDPA
ncbi:hypothetical protein G9U51_09300 [Calidifontibacter sp. DB0510]|uniref:Uncharacterized protein n=1 Tax=Metallococcus carri TaxID=1656884 RepID=A0A967B232_9MICO|nr:hypothetical protein [Metallococcus carri]NHN55970.1 hypothetical protein [Metallococcus carri]NOP37573.1 hypothetical protein [Calidifontibacter sp. DB2511S]